MVTKFSKILPFAVLGLVLVWFAALVLRFPTHGAIGNDPTTYVQMALDLVDHGTVTHDFPLFTNLLDQGLSWDAAITPGYHIVPATRVIVPNFAFGFPLLLAFGYRLVGESALYAVTPFLGLLSLLATFALAFEFWRHLTFTQHAWIGALAALLLATTPKQIQLVLVPMSDVPTQLFCLVAVWCALRAFRPSIASHLWTVVVFAILCGVAFGMAYLIRHSALVLVVPLAIIALWNWRDKGVSPHARIALVALALGTFVLTILPDLAYRTNVLGSPFAVESPESSEVVMMDAPRQFVQMIAALWSVTGIGPVLLLLFVLVGLWRQKQERFAIVVLSAWMFAFMLLHAPLRLTGVFENSLRYMLPAYPALALLAARALVAILHWGWSALQRWRDNELSKPSLTRLGIAALGILAGIVLLLLAVRALVSPERFVIRSYGWMGATARSDLDALPRFLPENAVLGVSDQMAGAVALYTGRDIFRPSSFREGANEFSLLVREMKTADRDVYLIGDWDCSPLATPGESLPGWLGDVPVSETGIEVRGLPYECEQRLVQIK